MPSVQIHIHSPINANIQGARRSTVTGNGFYANMPRNHIQFAVSPSFSNPSSSTSTSPCPDLDGSNSSSPATSATSSQACTPETDQAPIFSNSVHGLHLILPDQHAPWKAHNQDTSPLPLSQGGAQPRRKKSTAYVEPAMEYSLPPAPPASPQLAPYSPPNSKVIPFSSPISKPRYNTFKPLPMIAQSPDLSNPPNYAQNTADSFVDRELEQEVPQTPPRATPRRGHKHAHSLSSALNLNLNFASLAAGLALSSPGRAAGSLSPKRGAPGRGLLDEMPQLTAEGWKDADAVEEVDVVKSVVEWGRGVWEKIEEL